jgi:hypothetical protein
MRCSKARHSLTGRPATKKKKDLFHTASRECLRCAECQREYSVRLHGDFSEERVSSAGLLHCSPVPRPNPDAMSEVVALSMSGKKSADASDERMRSYLLSLSVVAGWRHACNNSIRSSVPPLVRAVR